MAFEFDHFFNAVNQVEIFIFVDVSHVTRIHPLLAVLVIVKGFCRCFGIVVVTHHSGRRVHQDLTGLKGNGRNFLVNKWVVNKNALWARIEKNTDRIAI